VLKKQFKFKGDFVQIRDSCFWQPFPSDNTGQGQTAAGDMVWRICSVIGGPATDGDKDITESIIF
jgi:hypothetical protein